MEPDIEILSIEQGIKNLDFQSAINLIANLSCGKRIYLYRSCFDRIIGHINSNPYEVGGLLLGYVWQDEHYSSEPSDSIIFIEEAIPSKEFRNSPVSLEMNGDVWTRAHNHVSLEKIVIGWYHSHPNLGAFFSSTDMSTQRAVFNHNYSLGLVIDPVRNEYKLFLGSHSKEYKQSPIFIDN